HQCGQRACGKPTGWMTVGQTRQFGAELERMPSGALRRKTFVEPRAPQADRCAADHAAATFALVARPLSNYRHLLERRKATPHRPKVSRISASDMNSTGAPNASPIAPPNRQPRKVRLCAGDGSRRTFDGSWAGSFKSDDRHRVDAIPVRVAYRNGASPCGSPS